MLRRASSGVDNVHTSGLGSGRTGVRPGRIRHVSAGAQCFLFAAHACFAPKFSGYMSSFSHEICPLGRAPWRLDA